MLNNNVNRALGCIIVDCGWAFQKGDKLTKDNVEGLLDVMQYQLGKIQKDLPASDELNKLNRDMQDLKSEGNPKQNLGLILQLANNIVTQCSRLTNDPNVKLEAIRIGIGESINAACNLYLEGKLSELDAETLAIEAGNLIGDNYGSSIAGEPDAVWNEIDNLFNNDFILLTDMNPTNAKKLQADITAIMQLPV